jgi:urease gamma subunit
MATVDPRDMLLGSIKVQTATDRKVLALLRQALRDVNRDIALVIGSGVGEIVRRDQLKQIRASLLERVATLNSAVGDTVRDGKIAAAIEADRRLLDYDAVLMHGHLNKERREYLKRSAVTMSQESVALAERRLFGSGYVALSERVYRTGAVSAGLVDSAVNSALARGLSAREFAASVSNLVNPATPGGVSYASMRLARTEINNAFHARAIDSAREKPWVEAMKWNLSGSHPEPDECNDYADDAHTTGGDAGVFAINDVPAKPHPHCLCFVTPVELDEDAFLNGLLRGSYDDYIDDQIEQRRVGGMPSGADPLPEPAVAPSNTKPPRPSGRRTR